MFDECHKAKNFVAGNEEASTKVAKAVLDIQRRLPKARVVYCSATGISDVPNMAYLERLGLWGKGLAFPNFKVREHEGEQGGGLCGAVRCCVVLSGTVWYCLG